MISADVVCPSRWVLNAGICVDRSQRCLSAVSLQFRSVEIVVPVGNQMRCLRRQGDKGPTTSRL